MSQRYVALELLPNGPSSRKGAGILPIGYPGSIAEFTDLDLFRSNAMVALRLGFDGGACIHPRQVPILNEAFTPTESEINRAEAMVKVYDEAMAAGDGAVAFEGKMIDVPVVARAQRVLDIRDKIRAKRTQGFKSLLQNSKRNSLVKPGD